ncbi:MAG: COX15/CtaA family protein [Pseudomonadota bacterium]|nr:COX15/CtaA family protein [Pseudomonadota bacterium]
MYRSLNVILILLLLVILAGGYVRIVEAGLACPDWPLCHGQLIPAFDHPEFGGKVFWEWGHRFLALIAFLAILYFAARVWFSRPHYRKHLLLLVALFCLQALLGALTVTELLASPTVNLHFFNALILLSYFVWLRLRIDSKAKCDPPSMLVQGFLLAAMTLLVLQFIIGSVVSTTYSGYACDSFPSCTGVWELPTTRSQSLHMLHRLTGVVVLLVSCGYLLLPASGRRLRWACCIVPMTAALQVLLGVMSIYWGLSIVMRTLHFGVALILYLLMFTITCIYLLSRPKHA